MAKSKKSSAAKKSAAAPTEGSSAKTPGILTPAPTARGGAGAAITRPPETVSADEIEGPYQQHEEVTEEALRHAPVGSTTATGKAIGIEAEDVRIESLDSRGGDEDLIGEAPEHGDYLGEPNELSETQQLPSGFVPNGSADIRMVGSPSGPQPVSTVARSREAAERRLVEQRRRELESVRRATSDIQFIDEQKIRSMSGAEARAVMTDRGYMNASDSVGLSNRGARDVLIKAQNEDPRFSKKK